VIEYLVDRGANPNFIKQDRLSPLMYACKHGAVDGVYKLCECKAEPNFQLPPGNTSLTIAAEEVASSPLPLLRVHCNLM
jgi:ankyrin repeat protein